MRLRGSTRAALILALLSAALVISCQAASTQPAQALTVFAAASLTEALADMKAEWESSHDAGLTYSSGSSTSLRTQIEQGAPADLFLSADTTNPQALVDGGLADGQVVPFAGNRVVIIVPEGNPEGIESAADLAREGICVVAAGENVPITRYAALLVDALGDAPGFGADFAQRYAANICTREDDARAVVTKVELAEGDVAIVYATDALMADVETVDLPVGVGVIARYGGVVLKQAADVAAARELLSWIAGTDGQQILADHGFVPAD